MNEKKYVVPEGMLKAFTHAESDELRDMLAAALRWLAENPIVPMPEQALAMSVTKPALDRFDNWELVRWGACEWQRRMFLAPEPEIPEAVKDLMWEREGFAGFTNDRESYNDNILEAYRRGMAGR